VRFRFQHTVSDFPISAEQGVMVFRYRAAGSVDVSVRGPSEDDVVAGAPARSAVVTTESHCVATAELAHMFSRLAAGHLPAGSLHRAPEFEWAREYVTGSGALRTRRPDGQVETWSPPLAIFPAAFRDYVSGVRTEAVDLVRRTVAALEWRSGRRSPRHSISSRDDEWSRDGRRWRNLPSDYGIGWVDAFGWGRFPDEALRDVENRVQREGSAPVGHTLLVEARALATGNPRASLLVGASAAEVGLKAFIAEVVPGSGWLAFNAPSPPVASIVANYLPELLDRLGRPELAPASHIHKTLDKGFTKRNRVIHGRDDVVSLTELRDFLDAVDRLLRILDYALGAEWAAVHIWTDDVVGPATAFMERAPAPTREQLEIARTQAVAAPSATGA
jgi:hypothetical protein